MTAGDGREGPQGKRPPAASPWDALSPDQQREFGRRRRARATATAVVLGALVVLIFALAVAKIHAGWHL